MRNQIVFVGVLWVLVFLFNALYLNRFVSVENSSVPAVIDRWNGETLLLTGDLGSGVGMWVRTYRGLSNPMFVEKDSKTGRFKLREYTDDEIRAILETVDLSSLESKKKKS